MSHPNFFIIGAPKCGTSSLRRWLMSHPNVFMSEPKSLDYFNTDFDSPWRVSARKFNRAFQDVRPYHAVVGEASTEYLYSQVAVPAILYSQPNARFLVCLRNPIELAVSWYGQMRRHRFEPEAEFNTAWRLQGVRLRDGAPRRCPDVKYLQYGAIASIGSQVYRLLQLVTDEQVCFIALEDMKEDPSREYGRVLDFLALPHDKRTEFPVENEAHMTNALLQLAVNRGLTMKRRLRLDRSWGLLKGLVRATSRPLPKPELNEEVLSEMRALFEPDQDCLRDQIGRRFECKWSGGRS